MIRSKSEAVLPVAFERRRVPHTDIQLWSQTIAAGFPQVFQIVHQRLGIQNEADAHNVHREYSLHHRQSKKI